MLLLLLLSSQTTIKVDGMIVPIIHAVVTMVQFQMVECVLPIVVDNAHGLEPDKDNNCKDEEEDEDEDDKFR